MDETIPVEDKVKVDDEDDKDPFEKGVEEEEKQ